MQIKLTCNFKDGKIWIIHILELIEYILNLPISLRWLSKPGCWHNAVFEIECIEMCESGGELLKSH